SGKKYKKCHLAADEASARSAQRIDGMALFEELSRFALRRFGEAGLQAADAFLDARQAMQLAAPWSIYGHEVQGRSVAQWYLAERGSRLHPSERAWLEQQCKAWLSLWEVTGVEPGTGLELRDLLSKEMRRVREVKGSRILVRRDVILARV